MFQAGLNVNFRDRLHDIFKQNKGQFFCPELTEDILKLGILPKHNFDLQMINTEVTYNNDTYVMLKSHDGDINILKNTICNFVIHSPSPLKTYNSLRRRSQIN